MPSTASEEGSLRIEGISASYGHAQALRNVALTVAPAEICVVLGSNGAGKTTLVRAITGFEKWEPGHRTGGSVFLYGRDVTRMGPAATAGLGLRLVPERVGVFLTLTVQENLRLALSSSAKTVQGTKATLATIYEMFPILAARQKQVANLLSGGERQMLGIGMGLLGGPSVLVVDEPSTGLAPTAVRQIFASLAEFRSKLGLTLLIVEQNVPAALGIADSVLVLRAGEIVHSGPARDVDVDDLYRVMTGA